MEFLLIVLFSSRQQVLQRRDLPALCVTAQRSRQLVAMLCIAMFIVMLSTTLGYHAIPFSLAVMIIATAFAGFVLSAMLASRLGRLCSTEKDVEHQRNIQYLCEMSATCLDYYNRVKNSGRPFTRLDLDELEAIFHRTK